MTQRSAGVEPHSVLPMDAVPPAEQFCRHFVRCFFCRMNERLDFQFCGPGRDLLLAALDEMDGRP